MVTTSEFVGCESCFHSRSQDCQVKKLSGFAVNPFGVLREEGREPDIWVTAHKHHLQVQDFGPWYRFQCPSNDGGSKWYTDMTVVIGVRLVL
jgi:hypothetical protein